MSEKKFCPECQKLGQKSRVYTGMTSQTLVAPVHYWDENGDYVYETGVNTRITRYECSNGHTFQEEEKV